MTYPAISETIITFSTTAFKAWETTIIPKASALLCPGGGSGIPSPWGLFCARLQAIRGEALIEETLCMSLQSHLAELQKRHQALENEITDCLAHPAVDDLIIVELKRRKLQVKEEIERLRHNGLTSVH
jgi:hypothetical protein